MNESRKPIFTVTGPAAVVKRGTAVAASAAAAVVRKRGRSIGSPPVRKRRACRPPVPAASGRRRRTLRCPTKRCPPPATAAASAPRYTASAAAPAAARTTVSSSIPARRAAVRAASMKTSRPRSTTALMACSSTSGLSPSRSARLFERHHLVRVGVVGGPGARVLGNAARLVPRRHAHDPRRQRRQPRPLVVRERQPEQREPARGADRGGVRFTTEASKATLRGAGRAGPASANGLASMAGVSMLLRLGDGTGPVPPASRGWAACRRPGRRPSRCPTAEQRAGRHGPRSRRGVRRASCAPRAARGAGRRWSSSDTRPATMPRRRTRSTAAPRAFGASRRSRRNTTGCSTLDEPVARRSRPGRAGKARVTLAQLLRSSRHRLRWFGQRGAAYEPHWRSNSRQSRERRSPTAASRCKSSAPCSPASLRSAGDAHEYLRERVLEPAGVASPRGERSRTVRNRCRPARFSTGGWSALARTCWQPRQLGMLRRSNANPRYGLGWWLSPLANAARHRLCQRRGWPGAVRRAVGRRGGGA